MLSVTFLAFFQPFPCVVLLANVKTHSFHENQTVSSDLPLHGICMIIKKTPFECCFKPQKLQTHG